MNASELSRLLALLRCRAAPFREGEVRHFVAASLTRRRVPHFADPVGNLIVGCDDAKAYRARVRRVTREPLRLWIAHMDHPGFRGLSRLPRRRFLARWLGGSPVRHVRGAAVWIRDGRGFETQGRILSATVAPHGRGMHDVIIQADATTLPPIADLYGGLEFSGTPFVRQGLLYARAADDLIGVFALMEAAVRAHRSGAGARDAFVGLLSRGEEVGLTGALAHLGLGWLERASRPIVALSIEASRHLPGAVIGKGPIVRLGDRATLFDSRATALIRATADRILPGRHQCRIMDGGTCEATAAQLAGLAAAGLAVPLGNYHNEGFDVAQGNPHQGKHRAPAPEFVHPDDITGLLRLTAELTRPGLSWLDPLRPLRARLRKNLGFHAKSLAHAP